MKELKDAWNELLDEICKVLKVYAFLDYLNNLSIYLQFCMENDMLNLFKNFITAAKAKERADKEYKANQSKIMGAIEQDILAESKVFMYRIEYRFNATYYSIMVNEIDDLTKIKFIMNHKSEFESMGYEVKYIGHKQKVGKNKKGERCTVIDELESPYKEGDPIGSATLVLSWEHGG